MTCEPLFLTVVTSAKFGLNLANGDENESILSHYKVLRYSVYFYENTYFQVSSL